MIDEDFFVPPEGPPRLAPMSTEIYGIMGIENITQMLEDFYIELGKSDIKGMFPEGEELIEASRKSAAFFVGLFGGPPLFHQLFGNPAMRSRHMRFKITEEGRLIWLECFETVLQDAVEKYNFPEQHLAHFHEFLDGFARWMVNSKGNN